MRHRTQRGVTLIELIIAISLVAAISAGMLSAFRMGLTTLDRTQLRLEDNRIAVSKLDTIRRHIGGAMPANGLCQGGLQPVLNTVFRGDAANLLLATNESLTEGSRGYPRIALYRILPNLDGTFRLTVEEYWFSGPYSTIPFCQAGGLIRQPMVPAPPESTLVLFERLGAARFEYRQLSLATHLGLKWQDNWVSFTLPYAVRLHLAAPPGSPPRMPLGVITIPFHITKEPGQEYESAP